jgi:hypothetical protein
VSQGDILRKKSTTQKMDRPEGFRMFVGFARGDLGGAGGDNDEGPHDAPLIENVVSDYGDDDDLFESSDDEEDHLPEYYTTPE